jgi:hypothetical protein
MRKSRRLLIDESQRISASEKHEPNWHLKQIAKGGVGLLGLAAIGGIGYSALGFFRRRSDRISSKAAPQIMGQIESEQELSGGKIEGQSDTLAIRDFAARKSGVNRQLTDITSNPAKTGLATTEQAKLIELGVIDFYEPTKLKESIATLSYPATSFSQASISSIEQTADGGYIAAGTGNNNFLIFKLNSTGDIAWAKSFGDSVGEAAYSIQQTADDGYIVAGKTQNQAFYNRDEALVLKLDESGNKVWAKTFDGTLGITIKSIQQTTDGGYITVGTNHIKPAYEDYPCILILKLDESGNKVWVKSFKSTGDVTTTSIQQTTDGGYIAAGYTREDFIILKLDGTGNKVWAKTLACSSFSCSASSVQQTNDGGYIVTGGITGYQDIDFDCFDVIVLKLDSAGNEVWVKTFDHSHCSSSQYANSIQQTTDGGYIAAGSVDISNGKALVFKLDGAGNKVWAKSFGSAYEEEIFSIRQIADGGYVAAGVVYKDPSYMYSRNRAFILKLDANGITARVGCGGQDIPWHSTNAITLTLEDATLFTQEASLTQASANSSTLAVWDQPDTIIICPSELTLTANTLTINEGASVILTTANINVGEQKQSASNLTISIGNVRYGRFEKISAAGTAITSFNLQELQESQIRFVHNGGVIAPGYSVKISHGIETTIPAAATIDFKLSLWLTIGATGAVVVMVAGCTGVMMRKHSHKTFRENFLFADHLQAILKLPKVNNFYSKTGRSYINMIYGVPTETDDWTMGDIKVDGIAIKLDGLLYKLYQAEAYLPPLTLQLERALAEIVGEAIHEILTHAATKTSGKHTKITLANIQEQLEAIVNKTRSLTQNKTSANSTLLMLSRMPDANRPEPREEQVGLLARNITDPVQQYMSSGMGDKTSDERASSLQLAM